MPTLADISFTELNAQFPAPIASHNGKDDVLLSCKAITGDVYPDLDFENLMEVLFKVLKACHAAQIAKNAALTPAPGQALNFVDPLIYGNIINDQVTAQTSLRFRIGLDSSKVKALQS